MQKKSAGFVRKNFLHAIIFFYFFLIIMYNGLFIRCFLKDVESVGLDIGKGVVTEGIVGLL